MNPAFFHACVSLHPLCGSTDQAAHHHHLLKFKFWASLADDTWLFTHLSFQFSIYNHFAPENIDELCSELSVLHNQDKAPVTSH
jgi:hypothetical protein